MTSTIKKYDYTAEYYFDEGCFINELSNSADDPAVSIARARVEVGQVTQWHSLIDITERYVILEGSGRVELGSSAPQDVTTGDIVIIPPGVPQRIENTGKDDLLFLAICTPRFQQSAYVAL